VNRRRFLATAAAGTLAHPAVARAQRRTQASDNTLRIAFPVAETGFDPAQVQDLYSNTINVHIFDSPLAYDYMARPPKLVPNTTVALPEVSEDFRVFTLRLRRGILFQDDPAFKGQPRELVAEDYAYSIKRVFDPRWKSQMLFIIEPSRIVGLDEVRSRALKGKSPFDYNAQVAGLQALDRYTLRIRLAEPNPRFVYTLTSSVLGAVAREVVEAYGDQVSAHPVGTGPFRLANWTRTSRIVLERNPTFREVVYDLEAATDAPDLADDVARLRGRRAPLVDRVEVSILQEDQPRWLTFTQGRIDILELPLEFTHLAVPNGQLAPHLARRGVRHRASAQSDIALTYFNMEDPVVGGYAPEHVALRRAIGLAFDGDEYIRSIYNGAAVRAQSPLVPGTFGYDGQPRTEMSVHDRAAAKALLDTYGYVDRDGDGWREQPDGSPLTLRLAGSGTQLDRRQHEQWRRFMSAVGLRFEFEVAQWPELLKRSLAGKLMMWGFGWTATAPDSDLFFSLAYGPNRDSANDARFDLPVYNRLYEQQRLLPDGPQRRALLREATRLLVAYMPYKFHLHRVRHDLAHPWVSGYRRHPIMQRQWLWIDVDGGERAERTA
jgi:ABC-type transport system substrate-binding protein